MDRQSGPSSTPSLNPISAILLHHTYLKEMNLLIPKNTNHLEVQKFCELLAKCTYFHLFFLKLKRCAISKDLVSLKPGTTVIKNPHYGAFAIN